MNARTVSSRWIGVALLIALVALLPTPAVQAEAPRATYSLAPRATHCEVELALEGGDPFTLVDDMNPSCADMLISEVLSVEFAGNTAWVRAVVAGEPVVQVFVHRADVWERIPYSSAPDAADLYLFEQENAYMEEFNPGATAAVAPLSVPDASAADAAYLYMRAQENAAQAYANPASAAAVTPSSVSADVRGSPYTSQAEADLLYMLEQENAYMEQHNPAATATFASPSLGIDVRGENYWSEWLARQEGSALVTPSRAVIFSDSEVDLIALAERELALAGGSSANTLADLLAEVFGSAWPGQAAAGEDLTRELE